jgi:thioredoxin 1
MLKTPQLTDADFYALLATSRLPAVVNFWATWCKPSNILMPILDEIKAKYEGVFQFWLANVDECPRVCERVGILTVPCIVVFRGGQIVERIVGALPKDDIIEKLEGTIKVS